MKIVDLGLTSGTSASAKPDVKGNYSLDFHTPVITTTYHAHWDREGDGFFTLIRYEQDKPDEEGRCVLATYDQIRLCLSTVDGLGFLAEFKKC